MGRFGPIIAAALQWEAAEWADLLLVFTVRFWKNAFKYHNLGYQLAAQDIGALLASVEQVARYLGWTVTMVYWFQDRLLASLLGLCAEEEAPFVVVTARSKNREDHGPAEVPGPDSREQLLASLPEIQARVHADSRSGPVPQMILDVHRATFPQILQRPTV